MNASEFQNNSNINVRVFDPLQDWKAYKAYYKALSKPEHYAIFFTENPIDAHNTQLAFSELLVQEGTTLFIMHDSDIIIGQAGITKENDHQYMFGGLEIADAQRNQKLSRLLHNVRIEHLKLLGFTGRITALIDRNNEPSLKAAFRKGFEYSKEIITLDDGKSYKFLSMDFA